MAYADTAAVNDDDVIRECQERLRLASDAESVNRSEGLTDLQFGNGEQWPTDIKRDRDTDARPCLTINITDAMVRRVTNALRENRPRIKFHPVGNGADVQTAKVRNGLMRHIETASGADYAYDCGVESAVRAGWGYWRVGSKYTDERSFDQDLTIEAIRNPFTVYFDPASREPDGSDASWVIVSDWMRRDTYRELYGEGDLPYSRIRSYLGSAFNFMGQGDQINDWSRKEEIRLAEYWRVVRKTEKLYLLKLANGTGAALFKDELPKDMAGVEVIRDREVLRKRVEWRLLSATQVLDKRDWPGKWIPIVPCYGRELDVNGKVTRKGMIRDLRDPARMYNYTETAKTEVYALQPKAPWLVVDGQLDGFEAAWRDANRKPVVALPYKPVRLEDGTYAPPPQRQLPPQPAAGFAEWSASSQSNFLAVAGMPHDPNQDMKGEVVSGIALHKRQGLSDISHFDFYDNQIRSMRHTGNIVSNLIPYFYDTVRIQRIINEDGTPDTATINEKVLDPVTLAVIKVKNDMTGGLYDTVVDTGPGYQTKRQEAADSMLELLGTPLGQMTAQVAGDVVVRSLDFPDSDLIADRMAAMIPGAQIDKSSDIPPKAQIMIQGLQAQLKRANQRTMALQLEIEAKHGLERMRQSGETERERMRIEAKVHDAELRSATAREDTHVRAVTAHDVAEIQAAGKLLDTHADHRLAAERELREGAKADERQE